MFWQKSYRLEWYLIIWHYLNLYVNSISFMARHFLLLKLISRVCFNRNGTLVYATVSKVFQSRFIYVTAHICACGLKKIALLWGAPRLKTFRSTKCTCKSCLTWPSKHPHGPPFFIHSKSSDPSIAHWDLNLRYNLRAILRPISLDSDNSQIYCAIVQKSKLSPFLRHTWW